MYVCLVYHLLVCMIYECLSIYLVYLSVYMIYECVCVCVYNSMISICYYYYYYDIIFHKDLLSLASIALLVKL